MAKLDSGRRNDSYFNGEWLRKTTVNETNLIDLKDYNGYLNIWYQLDLSSKQPLKEEQVRTALQHMYRKTPNLGCCFGIKDGEKYIKKCSNPNVDFEVVHGKNVQEIRDILREYIFNTETGPLYCVRLLQDAPDMEIDPDDIEPAFSHKSQIIFGINHVIVDGTTNMQMMRFFISLLNDVLANKAIDDTPLGTYLAGEEMDRVIAENNQVIENNPELKEKILKDMKYKNECPAKTGNCFQDHTVKEYTVSLVEVLDRETTSKFIQRCKKEGVTVNAAFSALCNVAIVDTLAENGFIEKNEPYMSQHFHCVNIRKYYEAKTQKPIPLGCHMDFPLILYSETPVEIEGIFWDYTRKLNEDMKREVQSGRILLDRAIKVYHAKDVPPVKNITPTGKIYESDYVTSNMGDITAAVTEGGDHVRITNLTRGTTIHKIDEPMLLNCHTFRGRWTMIFEYNARAVKDSIGRKMSAQVIKRLLEFIE